MIQILNIMYIKLNNNKKYEKRKNVSYVLNQSIPSSHLRIIKGNTCGHNIKHNVNSQ